jgi:hypothetical protein
VPLGSFAGAAANVVSSTELHNSKVAAYAQH